ncbi:major capsid protein [Mesorhizobium sp. M2A.F.Ca.ET.037.01.1.1]|uniref:major capsid protein n=1 Tax=Mesorhizobium sp. M2A.F.Ca.ET.037.01.1.1 TaxID=2496748 RepID=UPI000FCA2F3B|nr:major capsid protein [Mesorhizobium sp. M2A.F.Ca.ET.037.01.1.1]RUX18380.1 major capsid protein [Mesorhizobium sp. M2A.F.Ca.ET.037.01.1.1]
MHMDIFNDDAFSAVSMTVALEDYEFKPNLIGSMNLFTDVPIATEHVSVERRAGNVLNIIQTSERGAPLEEGKRDGRSIRKYDTSRIAKGHTIRASEISNVRAFGTESDLETMISYVGRFEQRLIGDVELTWENMQLGALQGKVLDADGSVIVDWFDEWGIDEPEEIDFALDTATTDIEQKCRGVIRIMMKAARGAWTIGTRVVGLAGDAFFDKLTAHKSVREIYLNTSQAQTLARAFGAATQSVFNAGSYAVFDYGGILFINYRGTDDFSDEATPGTKAGLGIRSTKCKFFPLNAPDVFQKAFAPGEAFDMVNTIGRPLYAMMIRDEKRNFWVRPEVYSYPLYICTRPEMLLTAKATAAG